MDLERYDLVSLIWRRVTTRFIGFESVEVDDLIVAQRGIGPFSIRSRVNQPPGVSDGNSRDEKPTDSTDKTLKMREMVLM